MTVHVQPTGMCPASHLHLIPSNVREAVAALGHEPHARALNTGVSGTCGTTTAVSVAGIYDGEDHLCVYVYAVSQSAAVGSGGLPEGHRGSTWPWTP